MIENLYQNINSKLSLILFGNPNRLNYNIFNLFYKIAISKNDIKSEKIYNLSKNFIRNTKDYLLIYFINL